MKHILITTLLASFLLVGINANGQSLKKANKEYELYAFNLAIKSYRGVLGNDPNNVEALSKMADCYRHLNQISDAITWYEKAVTQEGVTPTAIFNYALCLKSQGKYDEAKKWFLAYAEGNPYFGNQYAESCDFAKSLQGVPSLYRVKKEYLNKDASDFGPAFFQDQLIYSSARSDIKRNDGKSNSNWTGGAKNQLFITSRDGNGYLLQPTFLRGDYKNDYNEGPVSYSRDGKWVAFTKNNFVNGTRQIPSSGMTMSIYLAEVTGEGDWRDAKAFPYNGSGYSSGYPFLNQDATRLYFASDRPDGYGGYDIYVCVKTGDTWSSPQNLGPVVNSPGNELTPFVDNGTLYFSSDWHPGLGGLDIFRASLENGEWNRIFHLGNAINSSRDDYGLIYDNRNNLGYFTTNRLGGKGNEDIYQFSQLSDNIVIVVRSAGSNQPVANATIDFSACGEPSFTTDAKGQYSFQALPGLDCEGVVSKKGYASSKFTLTSDGRQKAQQIDIILTKEAEKFLGKVIDATDNTSVTNVFVRSTNQSNGQILETTTDENGNYLLGMQPNTTYVIRYSKMGYTDTYQRISTGSEKDKSILGIVTFVPSSTQVGSGLISATPPPTTPTVDGTGQGTGGSAGGPNEGDKVPESSTPELAQNGFAVQIAAMPPNQKIDVDQYKALESIGNVYSRPEKGFKKLRVGIFGDREEANAARRDIAKKGFPKAFVVQEALDDTDGVEVYNMMEEPKLISESTATPVATGETPPATEEIKKTGSSTVDAAEYMIRLAAYKNPQYFNAAAVSNLGVVEQRRSGNFTIMFLGGFKDIQQVKTAHEKAVASGFKGAYIVENRNGKLEKVNL